MSTAFVFRALCATDMINMECQTYSFCLFAIFKSTVQNGLSLFCQLSDPLRKMFGDPYITLSNITIIVHFSEDENDKTRKQLLRGKANC